MVGRRSVSWASASLCVHPPVTQRPLQLLLIPQPTILSSPHLHKGSSDLSSYFFFFTLSLSLNSSPLLNSWSGLSSSSNFTPPYRNDGRPSGKFQPPAVFIRRPPLEQESPQTVPPLLTASTICSLCKICVCVCLGVFV